MPTRLNAQTAALPSNIVDNMTRSQLGTIRKTDLHKLQATKRVAGICTIVFRSTTGGAGWSFNLPVQKGHEVLTEAGEASLDMFKNRWVKLSFYGLYLALM
jgi:hypothetical protein